jgi:methylmalonyl-CoA mutase cobalamin-binding subunit
MADRNGTLTANTVAMVTVEGERIEVLNRSGDAEIWVCVGGAAPSVGDQDTNVFCLPAVAGAARVFTPGVNQAQGANDDWVVTLISDGTPTYSVQPL